MIEVVISLHRRWLLHLPLMNDADFITDHLTAVYPDGTRSVIDVRVGRPRKDDGAYVCLVQAPGLSKAIGIFGESPMQALHLGLKIVRVHLELLEEKSGVRFVYPSTDTSHDWRQFWYGDGDPPPTH